MRRTFIVNIEWKAEWTADMVADWIKRAIYNQSTNAAIGPNPQSYSVRPQQSYSDKGNRRILE